MLFFYYLCTVYVLIHPLYIYHPFHGLSICDTIHFHYSMAEQRPFLKERQHVDTREPNRYKVLIHNDDFTTMEFVVQVLKEVFFLSESAAEVLMLRVHHEGKAEVGVYTYDVAVSKVRKATDMARQHNYPLRLTVEPAND